MIVEDDHIHSGGALQGLGVAVQASGIQRPPLTIADLDGVEHDVVMMGERVERP